MKKMNFTIKAILLCFVAAITLASCNRDNDNASGGTASIIGKWTCVESYGKHYYDEAELEYDGDIGKITYFYEDGRITGLLGGDGYTWSIIDDTLYITLKNGVREIYKILELTNSSLKIKIEADWGYRYNSFKR